MNKFFCSVIIPAFNSEKTIAATLESVKNQIHKNFEVIIINDGSTDKTADICRNFIEKHALPHWQIINQSNRGVSFARDHGISLSKSDFLFFLDSDDTWEQQKISKTLHFMQEHDLDICGENLRSSRLKIKIKKIEILSKNPFVTSSVCLKKNIYIKNQGFKLDQKYSEDYNLWLKIILTGGNAGIMPEKLTNYTIDNNPSSLSKNKKDMFECELINFQEMKKKKYINSIEYFYAVFFSSIKYLRRNILFYRQQKKTNH